MKNILLSGVLGAVIAVAINYAIVFVTICYGWKDRYEAPCLPELIELFHSGVTAVIVQTMMVIMIGFFVGAIIAKMK